jgi:raffinose/stachyose/melibiose transport system permease protein
MSSNIPRQIILVLYSLLIIIPLSLVLFTTFKTTGELYASPLSPPTSLNLDNYRQLFEAELMADYFINSVMVTLATVFFVLLTGSMVAYAISRMGGWLPTMLFAFFVAGLMVAPQVYMIPLYLVLDAMGLVNTLLGVILASIAFQLPIAVLILTGFMRSLPKEMIEAAFVDGASEWGVYRRIVVPLTAPAFASVAIFCFVITWNDLLFPLILIQSDIYKTLPLALLEFRGEYLTNYPLLFSGVIVATLPMLLAYLFLQRYFIEGMTAGSVKG